MHLLFSAKEAQWDYGARRRVLRHKAEIERGKTCLVSLRYVYELRGPLRKILVGQTGENKTEKKPTELH